LREESGERAPGRTVVAPLSESVRVPVGRWSWVALGDDWIAESSAPLDLTAPAASPQTVHLRQLRGCPLEIQPNEAWQRIEQVGILSTHFTNEVVLPRELLTRLVVPAGSNAILFYGSGGRPVALQTQLFCKAGQRLEVPPALPPEGERRAVVARLAVPPNLDDLDAGARLEVEAREAGSLEDRRGAPPASLVRFRHEVVALYPELPASDLELQVAGNLVRSERALLPSERGTVRVVPVALRPRQTLRLEVDLRLRTAGRSASQPSSRSRSSLPSSASSERGWGRELGGQSSSASAARASAPKLGTGGVAATIRSLSQPKSASSPKEGNMGTSDRPNERLPR